MRPSRHYELVSVRYLTFEDGPTDVRFRWLRYRLALRTMDADTAARKPNRAPSILDAGPDFVETDRMAYVRFPLAGLMKVVLPGIQYSLGVLTKARGFWSGARKHLV